MKIVFVVPVKNEEERIGFCLDSIKKCFLQNLECKIVVVDNGSSDRTVSVAKEYADEISVRPHDTVSGMRNFGASVFECDFLVFIDADVIVASSFLKNALKYFEDSSVAIVTGKISISSDSTWVQRGWEMNRCDNPPVRLIDWSSSMNMIIRKKVFEEVRGFFSSMTTCEDVDLSLRVRRKYKIIFDRSVFVIHSGEAKDLRTLFKKERWRGKSAIQLMLRHSKSLRRWVIFTQVPFFATNNLFFFFLLFSGRYNFLLIFSIIGAFILPLLRALIICTKRRLFSQAIGLFVIWYVYYFARSVALFDGCVWWLAQCLRKTGGNCTKRLN